MKPYQPSCKLAVRDSLEDEFSDDVEDDVFIRDGKISKNFEENGLKRPLMPPRRKKHKHSTSAALKKKLKCWKCCEPFCYGFIALSILIAVIFLAAILLTMFPVPLQKIKIWLRKDSHATNYNIGPDFNSMFNGELVACTQISVHKTWSKAFSKLNSESPVRKCDVNGDGIEDIIIGYGVDDGLQYDDKSIPKCDSENNLNCEGGLLALDGSSGSTLWQRWTSFNVFSLHCTDDLNGDTQIDCVAAGRGGLVVGVNGKNGEILWTLKDDMDNLLTNSMIIIDLYTVNSIRDLDDDNIADILAVHVEERETSRAGHIKLISGRTGKVIRSIPTPFREEVFVPIQTITQPDGTECLLITTGGQNSAGGLYLLRMHALMQYTTELDFLTIFRNPSSGFMVPAIITDITGDAIEDIIVSSFNSTVYAFDGSSYAQIWSFVFPTSETVSTIVPGHFDQDNVTDFMIKYNSGPGFPVYYYSQTTILSGVNGQPLLEHMMKDSGGPYSLLGGVSISQSFGGDFFLHWQTQCRGKQDAYDAYQFIPDSDIIQQARADTCMLRYNTSTVLKLYAIARHIEQPGAVIFSTDDLLLQLNQTQLAQLQKQNSVSPLKHPKMLKKILNREYVEGAENDMSPPAVLEKPELIGVPNEAINDTPQILKEEIKKRKKNYKKPNKDFIFNEENVVGRINPNEDSPMQAVRKGFIYPNANLEKQFDVGAEQDSINDEYENFLNYGQERKIPMRTKYPINRDVRSKMEVNEDYNEIVHEIDQNATNPNEYQIKKNNLSDDVDNSNENNPNHVETLWDLELEKETAEAIKDAKEYELVSRTSRQTAELNQNLLSSISSTGVLLKSIENTESSIDFVFALNVRESELYPPLFLPEDLACVEDKLSAYRSFTNQDLLNLEKKFLTQCLQTRLVNVQPRHVQKFEAQIVITRISITCKCGSLIEGEVCSKFNTIEKQKWTGFMGDSKNGLYTKL